MVECKTVCLKTYAQILLFLILHRFFSATVEEVIFLNAKALLLVFLIVAAFGGPIALNVLSAPTVSECVALAGNNFTAGSVDGAIIQPCGEEMDGPGMPT